jgi:hypothetical protein
MGPRAGVDTVAEKICLCRELNPDRPTRILVTTDTAIPTPIFVVTPFSNWPLGRPEWNWRIILKWSLFREVRCEDLRWTVQVEVFWVVTPCGVVVGYQLR